MVRVLNLSVRFADSLCSFVIAGIFLYLLTHPPSNTTRLHPAEKKQLRRDTRLSQLPSKVNTSASHSAPIKILLWTLIYGTDLPKQYAASGRRRPFDSCPNYNNCVLTSNTSDLPSADAVFISIRDLISHQQALPVRHSPRQHMLFYTIEAQTYFPRESINTSLLDGFFNLTVTHSLTADFPIPYLRYVARDAPQVTATRNYASGRDKMVLWIVSNCVTSSQREDYIQQLSTHVEVDVLGKCGERWKWNHRRENFTCLGDAGDSSCGDIGRRYKFYLAAENSICQDYITEKAHKGFKSDLIPIVIGGADYSQYMPPKSYIDIREFPSPAALGAYLKLLDANDTLYNEYFAWKPYWKLEIPQDVGMMWCRLCEYFHESGGRVARSYPSLKKEYEWRHQCLSPRQYYNGHVETMQYKWPAK